MSVQLQVLSTDHPYFREGNDKFSPATKEGRFTFLELLEIMPGQYQEIVRSFGASPFLRNDFNVCPKSVPSPLERIPISRFGNQVLIDTAKLQNRISLGRSAVNINNFTAGLNVGQ